ncbi:putative aspartate aminotransferase, cytoplasmic [Jimgerdemannia flammicorona]|uniref:Putative aspartate aminotransferase, cytoplasmic n=1 Tax=Jimgerdemannia flammicorona TaxID=994334 RepID=A0A433CJA5_9FUNG|nr:putative aspartate aminotransferase, cytoplasmic [Jimgerdemannia flammicorona]
MTPSDRLNLLTSHLSATSHKMSDSFFEQVPLAPPDVIFHLTATYKADTFPQKVNLGVGAYRTDKGKPWTLPVVKKADEILHNDPNLDHEYLPIKGIPTFTAASAKLMLGADSVAIKERRVAGAQSISGTGAIHLGALFLSKYYPKGAVAFVSNPTWANHKAIFNNVGIEVADYPYWNPATRGLDIDGFLGALNAAPNGSIIVLHACAHNPTGVDPSHEQWTAIADVMQAKKHFPFFDCAYQGFASGDLAADSWSVRHFVDRGFEIFVGQSYAKNFGLYGERCGCLTAVTRDTVTAKRVDSQFEKLQRSEISNPPAYGARLVNIVLNDPVLFAEWESDLRTMSGRIIDMRDKLYKKLIELDTPGQWNHIVDQIGMFSFTGLKGR